jgi:hypothetical protein
MGGTRRIGALPGSTRFRCNTEQLSRCAVAGRFLRRRDLVVELSRLLRQRG